MIIDALRNRYTTKMYDPTKKVSEEKIQQLKEVLQLCPSSINSQPWKFIIVSDEKLKNKLAEKSFFNKEKVEKASHLIVLCRMARVSFFEEEIKNYLPEGAINYYNENLKKLPEEVNLAWFSNQVYIALGVLLCACADLGIDATPMEGIEREAYTEILEEKNYEAILAVPIGYRDEADFNQLHLRPKQRRKLDNVVIEK